jgi:hypothetical protein
LPYDACAVFGQWISFRFLSTASAWLGQVSDAMVI